MTDQDKKNIQELTQKIITLTNENETMKKKVLVLQKELEAVNKEREAVGNIQKVLEAKLDKMHQEKKLNHDEIEALLKEKEELLIFKEKETAIHRNKMEQVVRENHKLHEEINDFKQTQKLADVPLAGIHLEEENERIRQEMLQMENNYIDKLRRLEIDQHKLTEQLHENKMENDLEKEKQNQENLVKIKQIEKEKQTLIEKIKQLENGSYAFDVNDKEANEENNGWIGANERTVRTWKNNFAEMSFIYDITLQKYKSRLENVAMLAFIIATLQTTLSFSNLGISEADHPYLALAAKITMIIFALIVNICNGMIKIYNWNGIVETYKGYVEKMEGFFTTLVSETELPKKLRKNALDFIIQHKTSYMEILRSSPDIKQIDYLRGSDQYIELKQRKAKHCKGIKLRNLEVELDDIV